MTRREQIVAAARELLEEAGPDALTMRSVGERLGIRAPSLYKHVASKEELEAELAAQALQELGEALAAARSFAALARAYRRWATAHPHLYRLATDRPLPRDLLPPGLEAAAAAPLLRLARGEHRARAIWAFAHGMTMLELAGRFPPGANLDAAWRSGIRALAP